jgi:hypothetical protein
MNHDIVIASGLILLLVDPSLDSSLSFLSGPMDSLIAHDQIG